MVLVVTVYAYDRGGWFSDPRASYELVARNQKGQAVWVADDEVVVDGKGHATTVRPSSVTCLPLLSIVNCWR